jgi:type IV pilus assembly protein PilV
MQSLHGSGCRGVINIESIKQYQFVGRVFLQESFGMRLAQQNGGKAGVPVLEAMMRRSKTSQAGFSMIEMLIAVVILAIGLLGLAELQVTAIKANSHSESIVAAGAIAQREIERIVAMSESDPFFTADTGFTEVVGSPITVSGAGDFRVYRSVDANHQGVPNVSMVTVRVQSAGAVMTVFGNRQRTVEVSTLKRAI